MRPMRVDCEVTVVGFDAEARRGRPMRVDGHEKKKHTHALNERQTVGRKSTYTTEKKGRNADADAS